MNNKEKEDYYTRQQRRADETLPYILWLAIICFVLYLCAHIFKIGV